MSRRIINQQFDNTIDQHIKTELENKSRQDINVDEKIERAIYFALADWLRDDLNLTIQVFRNYQRSVESNILKYDVVIRKENKEYTFYLSIEQLNHPNPNIRDIFTNSEFAKNALLNKNFTADTVTTTPSTTTKTKRSGSQGTGSSKKSSKSSETPRSALNASASTDAITPENASSKKTSPTATAGSSFSATSNSALSEDEKIVKAEAEAEAKAKRVKDEAAFREKIRAGKEKLRLEEELAKAKSGGGSEMSGEENDKQPKTPSQSEQAEPGKLDESERNEERLSPQVSDNPNANTLYSEIFNIRNKHGRVKGVKGKSIPELNTAYDALNQIETTERRAKHNKRVKVTLLHTYSNDTYIAQKRLFINYVREFDEKRAKLLNSRSTNPFIELALESKKLKQELLKYTEFFGLLSEDKHKVIEKLTDDEKSHSSRERMLRAILKEFDAAIKKRAHSHLQGCDLSRSVEITGRDLLRYLHRGAKFIRGMDVSGETDLKNFSEKTLSKIDFKNVYFENAKFDRVRFDQSNFKGATFGCVNFNLRMPNRRSTINVTIDKKNKKIILERDGKTIELSSPEEFAQFFERIDQQYRTQSKKESFFFKKDLWSRKELLRFQDDYFKRLEYVLMDRANQDPDRLTTFAVNKAFEEAVIKVKPAVAVKPPVQEVQAVVVAEVPTHEEELAVVETPSVQQSYVPPAGFPEGFSKDAVGDYTDIVAWVEGKITNPHEYLFDTRIVRFNERNESDKELNAELRNKVGIALGWIKGKNMLKAGLIMEALIAYYREKPHSDLHLDYDGMSVSIHPDVQKVFENAIQAWVKSAHDSQLEIYVPNKDPMRQHSIEVVAHFCPDIAERVKAEIASRAQKRAQEAERLAFEETESNARKELEKTFAREDKLSRDEILGRAVIEKDEIEAREKMRVERIIINAEPLRCAIHAAFEGDSINKDMIPGILSAAERAFELGSFLILNPDEKTKFITVLHNCRDEKAHVLSALIGSAFIKKDGSPFPRESDKTLNENNEIRKHVTVTDIIRKQREATSAISAVFNANSSPGKSGLFSQRRSGESQASPTSKPGTPKAGK